MPKYAALIYPPAEDEAKQPPAEVTQRVVGEYMTFGQNAEAALAGGETLHPSATATTITVAGGKSGEATFTDGPFAKTKEVLGGFCLIDTRRPGRGPGMGTTESGALVWESRSAPGHGVLRHRRINRLRPPSRLRRTPPNASPGGETNTPRAGVWVASGRAYRDLARLEPFESSDQTKFGHGLTL